MVHGESEGSGRRQRARVARDRLGARERAQAASGLTGSMRVSELVAAAPTSPTNRRDSLDYIKPTARVNSR